MRIAALILGILGGLLGLGGAITALFAGGVAGAFNAEGAETVVNLGLAAIPFAILGIVGGSLAMAKPKVAGWLMLISAIGGTIAISAGYILGGIMLFIAAIFALVEGRKTNKTATTAPPAP
jgi:hypothetical protein